MRGQRIEIYALASHMELRPTNTYSSLSHFLSLSERKRMQWQGKQGKKSKRGLGRKARTTSAFCERRPFVVATKNIHPSNVEQLPSNGLATFF